MLDSALKDKKPQGGKADKQMDNKHALMDLCSALASAPTPEIASKLLQRGLSDTLLDHKDGTLQKKTYKMLNQLFDSPVGKKLVTGQLQSIIEKLSQRSSNVSSAAKKVRTPAELKPGSPAICRNA
jgi:hypothetical protein